MGIYVHRPPCGCGGATLLTLLRTSMPWLMEGIRTFMYTCSFMHCSLVHRTDSRDCCLAYGMAWQLLSQWLASEPALPLAPHSSCSACATWPRRVHAP